MKFFVVMLTAMTITMLTVMAMVQPALAHPGHEEPVFMTGLVFIVAGTIAIATASLFWARR